ncbi:prepilin-type cleavage/methylation domain-containing protein [Trichlorobacter lovleyi]|uniref:prepilin-type cleavage/methylation domain-containing protein n=1 Tax=Trichlorobacter lovleyi TaxID=313985 RepID=UPI0023F541AE|nr:prepilin-type cleavage/methylation domain-containing protein [Trichlorobacter lovleyi]
MLRCKKGFTLVEIIVVTLLFILVIMAASSSFNVLLTQMAKLTKSEESNIEGVVGLEMLRHDLQQAGFGLPDAYMTAVAPTYTEATAVPANRFNDAPSNLPRALAAGDNLATVSVADAGVTYNILAGTDYLALKGVPLGMNETSQRWTYMPFDSGVTGLKKPRIWPTASLNLVNGDRVIMIKKSVVSGKAVNQMIYDVATPNIYWVNFNTAGFVDAFSPIAPDEVFYIYGIRPSGDLGMPFNRADYFVATPSATDRIPSYCAPNTGILYKATVNHADGALLPIPMLDCVADMQLVFGWDLTDGMGNAGQDGVIDTWSSPVSAGGALTATPSVNLTLVQDALGNPEKLRNSLKTVKVYLLAQVGRRDPNYQSPASYVVGGAGESSLTHTYDLTATSAMRNFHWKVYQLVVRPKNLMSNQ